MEEKNFLDQFSAEENKPESFQEEVFVPSTKTAKPFNFVIILVALLVVALSAFAVWFFLFRATIEVPSFVGQSVESVNSWIKQQGIKTSGVVFEEDYNDKYDNQVVIKQSIEAGKKIRKDAKLTFDISKGPDPNVEITVPDIITMDLDKINEWINTNKLTGVKINYEFSDTDAINSVITYEFGGSASATSFKRSSSLTITVSQGKQEDQPISVINLVGKNVTEATNWGTKNKIKIVTKEDYSSTVAKDLIISQSVTAGKKITSKESLTVTVSKGQAIIAPDFSSYSDTNISAWATKNNVNVEFIRKYSADVAKGKVIEQSVKNAACNEGMTVTISMGNLNNSSFTGNTLQDLKDWINEVNQYGAGLSLGSVSYATDEYAPVDTIISHGDIGVGKTISVKISQGKMMTLVDGGTISGGVTAKWGVFSTDPSTYTEEYARALKEANPSVTINFAYQTSDTVQKSHIISATRSDGKNDELNTGSHIPQSVTIWFTICSEFTGGAVPAD